MTSIFIPGSKDLLIITKSDTVNIRTRTAKLDGGSSPDVTQAVYIGGTGNIVAVMPDGTTCLIESIPAGTLLPIRIIRINSTDTTATKMVALF